VVGLGFSCQNGEVFGGNAEPSSGLSTRCPLAVEAVTYRNEVWQAEARQRRAEGATLAELARSYGVGKSTISRLRI
jgi:hypothetical protein